MIASIDFRRFRALRDAHLVLGPFNLVIGSNGSGKTSLLDALTRLRHLARLPLQSSTERVERAEGDGPEITFHLQGDTTSLEASLSCVSDEQCDFLWVSPSDSADWAPLRKRLSSLKVYGFDHRALGSASPVREGGELQSTGGNLGAVLHHWRTHVPSAWVGFVAELVRLFPEYDGAETRVKGEGLATFWVHLPQEDVWLPADQLSQGTLYLLGMMALAYHPTPPSLVAVEEIDRGLHPRMLRAARDLLYRLSYPESQGLTQPSVQVVATTHSPYLLDLFREHPEEVVISTKRGATAAFSRLVDVPGWEAIAATEGSLGDLWYSGLLGGVPEDGRLSPEP